MCRRRADERHVCARRRRSRRPADRAGAGRAERHFTRAQGRVADRVAGSAAGVGRCDRDAAHPGGGRRTVPATPLATGTTNAPTTTATSAASRSILVMNVEGGLVDAGGERASGWSGTLHDLLAQSLEAPTRTWLRAHELRGSYFWSGGPQRASLEPGSAEALGATLRWSRVVWQAGDGRAGSARLDAAATIDPLPIAPLLHVVEPDFGWGGDLAIKGRLEVRGAPSVRVDAVVERASGDLSVTDEYGIQRLGLTDLRLGVVANDGIWSLTAALAGETVGVASGAVTARTSPAAVWPEPRTPIEGVLEVRVAQLGTWGRWVPAGWRLTGELHASAVDRRAVRRAGVHRSHRGRQSRRAQLRAGRERQGRQRRDRLARQQRAGSRSSSPAAARQRLARRRGQLRRGAGGAPQAHRRPLRDARPRRPADRRQRQCLAPARCDVARARRALRRRRRPGGLHPLGCAQTRRRCRGDPPAGRRARPRRSDGARGNGRGRGGDPGGAGADPAAERAQGRSRPARGDGREAPDPRPRPRCRAARRAAHHLARRPAERRRQRCGR